MCSRLSGFCPASLGRIDQKARGSAGLGRLRVGEVEKKESRERGGRERGSFFRTVVVKFEAKALLLFYRLRKRRGHFFILGALFRRMDATYFIRLGN